MTQNQFVALCVKNNIAPEIALENDDIVEALCARDDILVEQLIQEQF